MKKTNGNSPTGGGTSGSGSSSSVPMVRGYRSLNSESSRNQDLTASMSADQVEQSRKDFSERERHRLLGTEIKNQAAQSVSNDNDDSSALLLNQSEDYVRDEHDAEVERADDSSTTADSDKPAEKSRKISAMDVAKDSDENKTRRALALITSGSPAYGFLKKPSRSALNKVMPETKLIVSAVDKAVLGENDGKGNAIRPAKQTEHENNARLRGGESPSEIERRQGAKDAAKRSVSASALAPKTSGETTDSDGPDSKKSSDKPSGKRGSSGAKDGGDEDSAKGSKNSKLSTLSKEILVAACLLGAVVLFSVFAMNNMSEQSSVISQGQGAAAGEIAQQEADARQLEEDAAAVYHSKCYASDTVSEDSALQATGGSVFSAGESDPVESVAGLEQTQIMHFQETVAVGKEMGLDEAGIKIGLMVEKAETNGWNYANDGKSANGALQPDQPGDVIATSQDSPFSDGLPSDHGLGHGGDHGSMGIMQQQFPWWGDGTVESLMNPRASARWFFEKLKDTDYKSMSPGLAAQSVQRSFDASGSNYTAHQAEVDELYKKIGSTRAGYNWERYKGSGGDPKPTDIDNKSYETDMADQTVLAQSGADTHVLAQSADSDVEVDGSKVLIIGDSLTVRAEKEIESAMSGVKINAEVGRSYQQGNDQLEGSAAGDLKNSDVVIMMLGTNGTFTKSDIDKTKSLIGGKKLVLMTVAGPNVPSEEDVNNIVKSSGEKYIDWAGKVKSKPELISDDGIHETIGEGTETFAATIAQNFGGGSAGGSQTLEKSDLLDEKSLETNAVRGGRIAAKRWSDEIDAVYGLREGDSGDHGKGRASDIMLKDYKGSGADVGDEISDFFIKNADELDVNYVIFKQRIYQPSAGNEWQPMEDRGSDNENHFNHVHVSYNESPKYNGEELKDIAAPGGDSSGVEANDDTASSSALAGGAQSSGGCGSLEGSQLAGGYGSDIIVRDSDSDSDDSEAAEEASDDSESAAATSEANKKDEEE